MKQRTFLIGLITITGLMAVSPARAQTTGRILISGVSIEGLLSVMKLKDYSNLSKFMRRSGQLILDPRLLNWLYFNVSPTTQLPYSFYIPKNDKTHVYRQIGATDSVEAVIERVIVEEGLVIYDGAVSQIVLTMVGGEDNLRRAHTPLDIYWRGHLRDLSSIRAGYPINQFVYDPESPELVSSDLSDYGRRGFIFRIINANGRYNTADPLDWKTHMEGFPTWPSIHWEDWKPVAGENAWVAMAALHLYHKKYFDPENESYRHDFEAVELKLAEELARAAMILQVDNGGIRMAPIGTYRNSKDFVDDNQQQGRWWYEQISSENNISWYGAFGMLYKITGNKAYQKAQEGIENYFRLVYNDQGKYFYQGMNYKDGQWHYNDDHFALDVQTWGVAAFGPAKLDEWFGVGAAYEIWQYARKTSGSFDSEGRLQGVGFVEENDRVSVEWTAGAILAAYELTDYYKETHPEWALSTVDDAADMRSGIEGLRRDLSVNMSAYSYSSRRGWIPFGWNSHDPKVCSLASTGWVMLVDNFFNPFRLP